MFPYCCTGTCEYEHLPAAQLDLCLPARNVGALTFDQRAFVSYESKQRKNVTAFETCRLLVEFGDGHRTHDSLRYGEAGTRHA